MFTILCLGLSALYLALYLRQKPEQPPEETVVSTGVVEDAVGEEAVSYTVRFTGQYNQSYVARTDAYTGPNPPYKEGDLVDIRYGFTKKGTPVVALTDPSLTALQTRQKADPKLLAVSCLFLVAGLLLLFL